MQVRQIKVGHDAYFVDVFYLGAWREFNLNAIPLSSVRKLRRLFK